MLRSSGRGPPWIVPSVSLVVVASSTVVAVHDEPAAHKTHTTAAARPVPAKPPAHKVDFGLAYGDSLIVESAPALAKSLNDAVSVGAGWIRMDLPWDAVQTTGPDSYDWRQLD